MSHRWALVGLLSNLSGKGRSFQIGVHTDISSHFASKKHCAKVCALSHTSTQYCSPLATLLIAILCLNLSLCVLPSQKFYCCGLEQLSGYCQPRSHQLQIGPSPACCPVQLAHSSDSNKQNLTKNVMGSNWDLCYFALQLKHSVLNPLNTELNPICQ